MMRNTVNVGDHHLRSVFAWVPELNHSRGLPGERPPCPRCKTTRDVVVKGWTQKMTRRAVLRGSCCHPLGYFYKCRNRGENNKEKPKVGCFSAWAVMPFSDWAQKQLIARTIVSPSTSCRSPLLVFTVVLLYLPSPELPDTGCEIVPKMECWGTIATSVFRPDLLPLFSYKKVCSSPRRDNGAL